MDPAGDRSELDDAEQALFLAAVEGDHLLGATWSLRRSVVGEMTDEELRPQADRIIRKLLALGWVRLFKVTYTPVFTSPGQQKFRLVHREEPVDPYEVDAVLRDPASWGLTLPYEVTLGTTDEGDRAVASGVLDRAYARFLPPPPPRFAQFVRELETRLRKDAALTYAGLIALADGTLEVHVTARTPELAAAIEAARLSAGIDPALRVVEARNSLLELEAVRDEIGRRRTELVDAGIGLAGFRVVVRDNRVQIDVVMLTTETATRLAAEFGPDLVSVVEWAPFLRVK